MKRIQSRIYRKIFESHYKIKIPKGKHIHHIDGNRENNDPKNLIMVSPEEHYKIHLLQGDPVALRGKFIQGASQAAKKAGLSRSIKKIKAAKINLTKNRRGDLGTIASVESRRKNKTFFFDPKYQKQMRQKCFEEKTGIFSEKHLKHISDLGLAKGKIPQFKDKIWNSSYEASLETKISASTIRYRCRNNILGWSYQKGI
jgi:hypothetical protein